VTFKTEGRLISVTERTITVNAVEDEAQGRKIIDWIKREINDAWEDRANIEPRYTRAERPQVVGVLKRLPKTNCKKCGAPTCMVFATWVVQGAKDETQCPELTEAEKEKLHDYLGQFAKDG
jgi:ArsR family metal-binding transcriptional regulator